MFLRQALEARLISLYVDTKQYTSSLSMANGLLRELKKIDDKALLVEVSSYIERKIDGGRKLFRRDLARCIT